MFLFPSPVIGNSSQTQDLSLPFPERVFVFCSLTLNIMALYLCPKGDRFCCLSFRVLILFHTKEKYSQNSLLFLSREGGFLQFSAFLPPKPLFWGAHYEIHEVKHNNRSNLSLCLRHSEVLYSHVSLHLAGAFSLAVFSFFCSLSQIESGI